MLAAGANHRRRVVRALVTLLLSVLVAMAAVCSELAAQTTKRSKQLNVRGFIAAPRATLLTFEPDPRARELLKPVLKAAMTSGFRGAMISTLPRGIGSVLDAPDLDPFWVQAMAVGSDYDYTGIRTLLINNPQTPFDMILPEIALPSSPSLA